MMETQNYWEDAGSAHSMQVKYEGLDGRSCKDEIYRMGIGAGYCEGNLNFATASEDDEVYTKKKVSRQDPMSHRIIEKRRRDRMNNCLADLSRLIPSEYLKKGRGRVEKTEIIEMAIRHMKHLQGLRQDSKLMSSTPQPVAVHPNEDSVDSVTHPSSGSGNSSGSSSSSAAEHYRLGYQECLSETMHFLVEVEGYYARDSLCVQLVSHLQQHCDKILASSDRLGFPHHDQPINGGAANSGVNQFAHANGGPLSGACLNGNGVGHLNNNHNNNNNNHNNNNNNNSSHSNLNNVPQYQHQQPPQTLLGGYESVVQRPLLSIPPPSLVSDDSNHSCHSHASFTQEAPRPAAVPPTNYKFKNSIKQRFSAERVKTSPGSPPACSSSDASSSKHSSSGGGSPQHQGVPIFALHDNGGFYVPLTVEAALLRPHMGYPDLGPEAVLHPVTISVNFNHASTPVWSSHHPAPSPPPVH